MTNMWVLHSVQTVMTEIIQRFILILILLLFKNPGLGYPYTTRNSPTSQLTLMFSQN